MRVDAYRAIGRRGIDPRLHLQPPAVATVLAFALAHGLRQRFIEQMARRVGGRAVAPDLDDLGGTVVDEYLRARSRGRDDDLLW